MVLCVEWGWGPVVWFLVSLYLILHWIRYRLYDSAPVRLIYHQSSRNLRILQAMHTLPGRFYPTPYLVWPTLQTLYVIKGRPVPPQRCHDETLDVEPDERIMLTWMEGSNEYDAASETPIVIIVHGINGNASKAYLRQAARVMRERGWRALMPTRRGCNPLIPNQRPYEYRDPDFAVVVAHVHGRFPRALLYAVGMSAGANVVTKYIGETGDRCLLAGAVSMANGFDWNRGTKLLRSSWWWDFAIMHDSRQVFYSAHRKLYSDPESPLHGRVCPKAVWSSRGMRDFDEAFHVKVHQYDSVEAYYEANSCIADLPGIAVPMLFLHAEDDPLVSCRLIPAQTLYANPNCIIAISNRGGHLGWAQGWLPCRASSATWAEEVAADYIAALLATGS